MPLIGRSGARYDFYPFWLIAHPWSFLHSITQPSSQRLRSCPFSKAKKTWKGQERDILEQIREAQKERRGVSGQPLSTIIEKRTSVSKRFASSKRQNTPLSIDSLNGAVKRLVSGVEKKKPKPNLKKKKATTHRHRNVHQLFYTCSSIQLQTFKSVVVDEAPKRVLPYFHKVYNRYPGFFFFLEGFWVRILAPSSTRRQKNRGRKPGSY